MDVLYIVMPAFNEEANIEKTVREWYAVLSEKSEDSRLVVADSGSTDKTHDILLEMQEASEKESTVNSKRFMVQTILSAASLIVAAIAAVASIIALL